MWTSEDQQHLDDLQARARLGTLTTEERQRLDHLLGEVEKDEWARLQPALSQLHDDHDRIQTELHAVHARNAQLRVVAERYADLLARGRAQSEGLIRERNAQRGEYERTLR
jgi:hypothetical protein